MRMTELLDIVLLIFSGIFFWFAYLFREHEIKVIKYIFAIIGLILAIAGLSPLINLVKDNFSNALR